MNPSDFVYNSVYNGAISAGATEQMAKYHATDALDRYKQSRISGKVFDLIKKSIAAAKKDSTKKESGDAMRRITKLKKMAAKEEDFSKVVKWAIKNIPGVVAASETVAPKEFVGYLLNCVTDKKVEPKE